ncbi:MAG TPA: hypothetical protein VFA94_11900 [Acidimicrobiales bacterium]|nr:hypothetical protein [Acidimicrobiales bacterium]
MPAAGPAIGWLPADLPLPPGTYPVADLSVSGAGIHQATFVVKMDLRSFVLFVTAEWPKHGWALGRGDAEAGEAESPYRRANEGGAWRVRSSYCDATQSELLLVYKQGG